MTIRSITSRSALALVAAAMTAFTVIGCSSTATTSTASEAQPQRKANAPMRLVAGDSFGAAAFRLEEPVAHVEPQLSDADADSATTAR